MPKSGPSFPSVVVASAARTTSSDSGSIAGWGGRQNICAKLIITAVSGTTPSMTVTIEHSDVAGSRYTVLDTFPAQTATTTGITRTVPYAAMKAFVRVAWAIT